MRAGYLVAPARIELHDDPTPVAGPGELVVRVRVALTDGTDLKAYRRGHPQMPMPTRFGHEFAGDVAAVGAGVSGFAEGDGIMSVHSAPCGACWWCAHDEEELCATVMGTKILGAYAEYITLPAHIVARNAYRKPSSLSYEAAAFLEPLACVVHSVRWMGVRPDARVAVIGDGGFGILHGLVLRAFGFPEPVIVGRRSARLAVARAFGLETLDATGTEAQGVAAELRARTEGRGMDAVIESTGTAIVWESAPGFVRRGGTVSLFGGLPGGTRVAFDSSRLHYDEVRVISPFHFGSAAVRAAHDLLVEGRIDPLPLITHRFRLNELDRAFAALDAGDGLKYAIVP
ncbi:MAG: alcohol dehydrogenase catalytic domain-containing protein [Candidatus Velthaea sp.]